MKSEMPQKRLLIVEDEGIIAADLANRVERLGYCVVGTAASAPEAIQIANRTRPDLVLMDIVLRGPQNGITAAARIRDDLGIPIVFVTSHADSATVHSALGAQPFGYVLKPFNERELQAAIAIGLYRHETESKLRKMERWLATTLSSIGDAVIVTDLEGQITLINPVAQRLTGWLGDEAVGQPLESVFAAVDATTLAPLSNLVSQALVEGFSIGIEEHVVLLTRGGPGVAVDDSIAPIRDEMGRTTGVVLVFRDASARYIAQQQAVQTMADALELRVQERTSELIAANRALTAFAASVSHDLRAPILAVKGLSAVLSDRFRNSLDPDGLKFLDMLKAKSHQMEGMIDDFLSLFRVQQMPLKSEPIDSQSMVAEVVAALQRQSARVSEFKIEVLPQVTGDPGLIRQVWVNLLVNAVKFSGLSSAPKIEVDAAVPVGSDMVEFTVRDNGIGFEQAQASGLFELFRRQPAVSEFEGHGVGLAIVQAVVERHGGQVRAEGTLGHGAAFTFSLPGACVAAH